MYSAMRLAPKRTIDHIVGRWSMVLTIKLINPATEAMAAIP